MKDIENVRDYPVKKSNDMIQKVMFNLTAQEFDLLQYIVMQIKDTDLEFKPMEISIQKYCEIANIQAVGKNYENIKKSLKGLRDKSVWIEDFDGKGATLIAWIDAPVRIDYGSGTVKLQLSKVWEPYLLELKKRYTVTTMREILPMKSVYGKRMYELLKSYLHNKDDSAYVEFTVDELKKKLLGDQWDKKYHNFKDFNAKVLKPAMRDLEQYGNLQVKMTMERMGRSYRYIYFGVKYKSIEKRMQVAQNEAEYFEQLPGQEEMDISL